MPTLESLVSLVPPPATRAVYDWEGTEALLGRALPADYKELAETYGRGSFCDFLTVLVPAEAGGIAKQGPYLRDYVAEVLTANDQQPPVELDAADPAVLGWGGTGNGDSCLWHTIGEDPNTWAVLVTDSKGVWDYFDGGVVAYLTAMLLRTATSAVIDFAALAAAPGPYFTPAEGD